MDTKSNSNPPESDNDSSTWAVSLSHAHASRVHLKRGRGLHHLRPQGRNHAISQAHRGIPMARIPPQRNGGTWKGISGLTSETRSVLLVNPTRAPRDPLFFIMIRRNHRDSETATNLRDILARHQSSWQSQPPFLVEASRMPRKK